MSVGWCWAAPCLCGGEGLRPWHKQALHSFLLRALCPRLWILNSMLIPHVSLLPAGPSHCCLSSVAAVLTGGCGSCVTGAQPVHIRSAVCSCCVCRCPVLIFSAEPFYKTTSLQSHVWVRDVQASSFIRTEGRCAIGSHFCCK